MRRLSPAGPGQRLRPRSRRSLSTISTGRSSALVPPLLPSQTAPSWKNAMSRTRIGLWTLSTGRGCPSRKKSRCSRLHACGNAALEPTPRRRKACGYTWGKFAGVKPAATWSSGSVFAKEGEPMDFSLTEQEELFRRAVRDFVTRELAPRAAETDAQATFPTDLLPKMGDLGVFGVLLPAAYGGSEAGMLSYLVATEEISAGGASTGFTIVCTVSHAFVLNAFATDEIKSSALPRMAAGRAMGAFCITEPDAGEDIGAIQTVAREEGNHYRVNGTKTVISNAGLSEFYALILRTRPGYGVDGLTMLLVEKGTPGFTI